MAHLSLKKHPLVLEISARILIQKATELNKAKSTFREVPDSLLSTWSRQGFHAVWFMGVWTTGEIGRQSSLDHSENYHHSLPDWTPGDVSGSPYAIQDYCVHPLFGGNEALATLRERMAAHGLSLILDFVPNHTAHDHDWVSQFPDYYVRGNQESLQTQPQNYSQMGEDIFAYGRDPYFAGWADTFQLDYRRKDTREAMIQTLLAISEQCDAVRCDMAMLVLSDVFEGTWGTLQEEGFEEDEFWATAIDRVRSQWPDFQFIGEAYWQMEARLQMLGFDYTYNKTLYDHLQHHSIAQARASLEDVGFANQSVFFIENHDEPRAVFSFPNEQYRHVAAFLSLTLPGMRLVHDGQLEGRKRHHSVHLGRRQEESENTLETDYYRRLFEILQLSHVGQGNWKPLEISPTGNENPTSEQLMAFLWDDPLHSRRNLVIANTSARQSEGFIPIRFFEVGGRSWILEDLLSEQKYHRDGTELSERPGLYVRLQPYQKQIFDIKRSK